MTNLRRALPLMVAAAGGTFSFLAGTAVAATPAAKAPGRVVFPVDGGVVSTNPDGGGAAAAVTLPGGGAVVAGNGGGGGSGFRAYVAGIRSDGSLDTTFGNGGIVTLPGFLVNQVVREADGSLIVAGSGPGLDTFQLPAIVLVHLRADGTLDSSFGTGGVATLPVESSCGNCAAASVLPDGDLVVTGDTGRVMPPLGPTPRPTRQTQWVLARVTPTGALDPSFGQAGVVTLAPTGADGTAVAALANGDVVALGRVAVGDQTASLLTRLLPSGAADPTFNAGSMVAVPGGGDSDMIANADGTVIVDATSAVVRYTAAGQPDPSFGTSGVAPITGFPAATLPFPLPQSQVPQTRMLPAPGDSAVLFDVGNSGVVTGERLTPSGTVDPTFGGATARQIALGFGGGGSGFVVSVRPRPVPPLVQDSTDIRGTVVERADGSFLAVNGVKVIQPTGEGEGLSIFDFAVAGLTPSFTLDPSFGGPETALYAKLRVIRQRASTARTRHGIRVELTLSQPGLALVVVKANGRVIAQNLLPVFAPGAAILPVELTSYGNQLLRRHRGIKVSATAMGRDLLTNTATSTSSATLR